MNTSSRKAHAESGERVIVKTSVSPRQAPCQRNCALCIQVLLDGVHYEGGHRDDNA